MAGSGAWSDTMPATEEIQKICDQVKPDVEKMTGKNCREFKAIKYRNQIVTGGQNYIIKVHVGGKDYFHLSLYGKLDGKVVLVGVEQHKTKDDPLTPFPN